MASDKLKDTQRRCSLPTAMITVEPNSKAIQGRKYLVDPNPKFLHFPWMLICMLEMY